LKLHKPASSRKRKNRSWVNRKKRRSPLDRSGECRPHMGNVCPQFLLGGPEDGRAAGKDERCGGTGGIAFRTMDAVVWY